jgi:hypothetical protein
LDNLISLNLTNGDGQRTPILLVVPGKFPSSKPKSSFQETLLSINAYITSLPNYLNNVKQKIDLITFSDATNLKIALHEWLRNIQ